MERDQSLTRAAFERLTDFQTASRRHAFACSRLPHSVAVFCAALVGLTAKAERPIAGSFVNDSARRGPSAPRPRAGSARAARQVSASRW